MSYLVNILQYSLPAIGYPIGGAQINIIDAEAEKTVSLLNEFSKCPQAKDFLARVANAVSLSIWFGSETSIKPKTAYADQGPLIFLFPHYDPMGTLAFELNNALVGFDNTKAKNGEQGIDEYAKQLATGEHSSDIQRYQLWKECYKDWGASDIPYAHPFSKKVFLTEREWDGTLDVYRGEWRKKYQRIFCEKHPYSVDCIHSGTQSSCKQD